MCINGCLKHSLTLLALLGFQGQSAHSLGPSLSQTGLPHPLIPPNLWSFSPMHSFHQLVYNCPASLALMESLGAVLFTHSTTNICFLDTL